MPLGLLPMAEILKRDGHDVEIAHAGNEEQFDAGFSVEKYVEDEGAELVCLPLHWHQQTYEVREALKRIKARTPKVKTVLGGLTASWFAADIINEWPEADYVIRGEGEKPLKELAAALAEGKKDLSGVPNLVWRKRGRTTENKEIYVAGPGDLAELVFTDRSLIRNHEKYTAHYYSNPEKEKTGESFHHPLHYLYIGRGCTADCAFCGGGAGAHKLIANRDGAIFRDPDAVYEDIKTTYEKYGITDFYACFNPPGTDNGYFTRLFDRIGRSGMDVSMVFEYYNGVPDEAFIEAFASAFNKSESRIAFSPTSFSDEWRPCFYPPGITGTELETAVKNISKHGIQTLLYYALLPGETEGDIHDGLSHAMDLRKRHASTMRIFPIEMEPASPWSLAPKKYGISLKRKTLADYLEHHARGTDGFAKSDLGYSFPGFGSSKQVFDLLARFTTRLYE